MTDPELSRDYLPPFEAVTTAYADVVDYNAIHANKGFAGIYEEAVLAMEELDANASAEDVHAAVDRRLGKVATEGDMHGELQKIVHEDTFMRIGIALTPGGGAASGTYGVRANSQRLLPEVENSELFVDFLATVGPEEVRNDKNGLALVTDVVTTLQRKVEVCYGEVPEGTSAEQTQTLRGIGEDAIRTFLAVEESYKDLGLDNPAAMKAEKALNDYAMYWGRDVLPEYIATGSPESLATDKVMYFDGMHDKLEAQVDAIVALTQAERTKQFGLESAQAMIVGMNETGRLMEEQPDEWFVHDYNKDLVKTLTARLRAAVNAEPTDPTVQ